MARRARIGILRARHDPSVGTIPDRACLEMFFHNDARTAVFDYWERVTRGWLDFRGSELLPWVDITLTGEEARNSRAVHGQKAYEALRASGVAVASGFDGWVVLTLPGTVVVPNPDAAKPGQPATITVGLDGGAGGSVAGAPLCSLPVASSNHTFMCHELGHVLGFKHTYGLFNNGIDWDRKPPWDQGQVYGDPYDVMSSASFGTRNLDPTLPRWVGSPVFAGTTPVGWPNPNAMGSMGPAPSPAHLHQWDEGMFPDGVVRAAAYPAQGRALRVRLTSSGRNSNATSLLMLRPNNTDVDPEGRYRLYVEYRGIDGWDRGLKASGTDLARRAVVVHTRTDAPGDGVRTWYRGRVLVPTEVDTDVAPATTPLVVRVVGVAEDLSSVEVVITTAAEREVMIDRRVYTSELAVTNPQPRQTVCGTFTWATRIQQTTTHFTASTAGYGGTGDPAEESPRLGWTVGGVAIPDTPDQGSVEVPTPQGTFTVQYDRTGAPGTVVLVGRGGERYEAAVRVTATEPSGDYGRFAEAAFDPVGWVDGFSPEDTARLDDCLKRNFDRVDQRVRDWIVPVPPEDPGWGQLERINIGRIEEVARRVADTQPGVAVDLQRIAELRRQVLRGGGR